MTLYGECPQDKPKCEKENCKYYDESDAFYKNVTPADITMMEVVTAQ